MLSQRVRALLQDAQVEYEILPHAEAFTAQETAAATEVAGRQLAKVVMLRDADGHPVMAVLPAPCRVDVHALAESAGVEALAFVPERDFREMFPDCEPGAMPPFGELYRVPTWVDRCFDEGEDVFFAAGNHREVVRMPYREFDRLAHADHAEFCIDGR